MKKSIKVQIYKTGTDSDVILRLIGNYNEGKGDVSPRDIEGYFAVSRLAFPYTKSSSLVKGDSDSEWHISEDGGKTFTMSLEWCIVHELAPIKDEEYLPNNINA